MPFLAILGGLGDGRRTSCDGQYLKTWDVNAHDGRGSADFTKNEKEAHRFTDMGEFHRCWTQVPTCRPLRGDGQPNRPLTAFTFEMRRID